MRRLVRQLLVIASLACLATPALAAAPKPPSGGTTKGGGGTSPSKPSGGAPKKPSKKTPKKKKPTKKVPPKKALRGFIGPAFRTNDVHPYAPETYLTLGVDYEQPAGSGFTYAPGFRVNHTAVDTNLYEGIVTARYKFGPEKSKVLPYAVAGAGAAVMNHPGGNTFGGELRAGGGASWKVTNSFRVGLELTGVYLLMANDVGNGIRDEIGMIQLAVVPEIRF